MERKLSKTKIESFCGDVVPLRLLGGAPGSPAVTWSADGGCVRVRSFADEPEPFTEGVLLTLMKPGSAAVTASCGGETYTCAVEVRERKAAASGPDLDYFIGDMHDHTSMNHKHREFCARTEKEYPIRYLEQVRDKDMLDFCVVSDHADTINPAEFFRCFADAEDIGPMRAVVFPGSESEVTVRETDRYGVEHKNSGEIVTLNAAAFSNAHSWEEFFTKMEEAPFGICTLAHPQIMGYSVPGIWNFCLDKNNSPRFRELVRLVELGDGSDRSANLLNEYVYSLALDNGFRISPTNSSDSHGPVWGACCFPGKTIIMAPERSREAFLDAYLHNRVYACQSGNVKLYYEVNGHPAPADLPEAEEYRFDVSLSYFQTNLLSHPVRCQVISDGGLVAAEADCTGLDRFSVTVRSADASYFYLRLIDYAGKKTWSCPVWTGRKPAKVPAEPLVPLDKAGFTAFDETDGQDAGILLNDDPHAYWRSGGTTCSVHIDMHRIETVAALSHYPRILTQEDAEAVGLPQQFLTAELPHGYRIWSSLDGEHWTLCREGIFRVYGGEETVRFPETKARYIRLEITTTCGVASERGDYRRAHVAMAELTLWKKA